MDIGEHLEALDILFEKILKQRHIFRKSQIHWKKFKMTRYNRMQQTHAPHKRENKTQVRSLKTNRQLLTKITSD